MLKTAVGIVKEEGFIRLWKGITPAIYRHAIYTGVRFGAYEKMRENVFKKNPDGSYSLWYIFIIFSEFFSISSNYLCSILGKQP